MIERLKALLRGSAIPPLPDTMPPVAAHGDLLARFVAEAEAVGAVVHRGSTPAHIFGEAAVAAAVTPDQPLPAGIEEPPLALTRPAYLIADSGTLVELYQPGAERSASALAAVHAAVCADATLVSDLTSFYALYRPTLSEGAAELAVFVTGPSRTADIEQTLVLGAHGPKALHIFIDGL